MGCVYSNVQVRPIGCLLKTLEGHTGGVICICCSPDLSIIATGAEDKTIRLWSFEEPNENIKTLVGHTGYVNCMIINNTSLFTGSADKTIRKWDLKTYVCNMILQGHSSLINRLLLVDDLLFSSSYDKTVRCWHCQSGDSLKVFQGHKRGVYPLYFIIANVSYEHDSKKIINFNGSRLLLTGSADATSKIWLFDTSRCLHTLKGHFGAVICISVFQLQIFTGSADKTIRSWSLTDGTELQMFKGHQGPVLCIYVRPCVYSIFKSNKSS